MPDFNDHTKKKIRGWNIFIDAVGLLLIILSMIPPLAQWWDHTIPKTSLALIAVGPPIWLWYEYFWIWRDAPPEARPELTEYKYGHDVSRNIWIGLAAAIVAIYFKS